MRRLSFLARATLLASAALASVTAVMVGAPRSAWAAKAAGTGDPQKLEVAGHAPAYFYPPGGGGLQPILMFLHGRGGNPSEDCRKWARVATQFGWVVCPQGPEDRGGGARGWGNNPVAGKDTIDSVVKALRAKYNRRVQLRNNVLIGFSEGSFIAMQVGIKDPQTWDKWLILAANDQYWWGEENKHLLEEGKKRIHRVYLYTGQNDEVAENTKRVEKMLRDAKIPVRMNIVNGLGHEVPADRMVTNYRRPLLWLMAAKKP